MQIWETMCIIKILLFPIYLTFVKYDQKKKMLGPSLFSVTSVQWPMLFKDNIYIARRGGIHTLHSKYNYS